MDTGYQHNFKEIIPERLKCPICHFVFRYPHQLMECGHRYCYGCLETYLRENEATICPMLGCDEELTREKFFPDTAIRKEIEQLVVYCDFKDGGCRSKMQLKDLDRHKSELCDIATVNCRFKAMGCAMRTRRKELAEHLENVCIFRQVQCEHCSQVFCFRELQGHYTTCLPICCPNKCSKRMSRNLMVEHLKHCPNECPYTEWGCTFPGCGRDIIMHGKNPQALINHLSFVRTALASLKSSSPTATEESLEIQKHKNMVHSIKNSIKGSDNSRAMTEEKGKKKSGSRISLNISWPRKIRLPYQFKPR